MNPTEQRYKDAAAIFSASADGRAIEYNNGAHWVPSCPWKYAGDVINNPSFYRIKPEPVTRPWSKESDVPQPCWIAQPDGSDRNHGSLILSVDACGVAFVNRERSISYLFWREIAEWKLVYSTDRKTWQPCVVTEPQP